MIRTAVPSLVLCLTVFASSACAEPHAPVLDPGQIENSRLPISPEEVLFDETSGDRRAMIVRSGDRRWHAGWLLHRQDGAWVLVGETTFFRHEVTEQTRQALRRFLDAEGTLAAAIAQGLVSMNLNAANPEGVVQIRREDDDGMLVAVPDHTGETLQGFRLTRERGLWYAEAMYPVTPELWEEIEQRWPES